MGGGRGCAAPLPTSPLALPHCSLPTCGRTARCGCTTALRRHTHTVQDDRFKALKHFKPYFPGSHESLEEASRLFTTFVFQKTKGDPEPPPPREPSAQQQQQQAAAGKRPREEDSGAAVPAEERTAGGDAGGQEGGQATKKAAQYKRPSVQRKPRTAQEPPGDAG